ncbi:MAG: peptide MFS transporter [Alphaproteobacteria bacterium]|nr:peptide MFS transporter [Alphaproteobacteria bacterium]
MQNSQNHPKGLYVLFTTEMWERFNFYGLRALLVLFMTKVLLFDKTLASHVYGSYTSLIYLSPLFGGFMADKFWGNKKAIIYGGLVMALGQLFLFMCASFAAQYDFSRVSGDSSIIISVPLLLFFIGLGFMIGGNGFFKANISSLVGQLYVPNDSRKNAAYTLFYMGINVGGALGPYICGLVGDTGNPLDFRWGFLAGGIGMLLSVLIQIKYHSKYVKDPEGNTLGLIPKDASKIMNSIFIAFLVLIGFSILSMVLLYLDTMVIDFLFYLLFLCVVSIAGVIFTDNTLDTFQKKKVLVIFIVSFFVIFFWSCFEQAGASLTFFADEQTDRSLHLFGKTWLVPTSWFQSVNSTFIVILAFIFAWVWQKLGNKGPNAFTKMSIGLFILALSFLWIAYGVKSLENNPTLKISMFWLIGIYFMHTCGELFLSPIGMSLVNTLSPLKYSSLLMAVWFTSNASANKLAGELSALYPDPQSNVIKSFMGFTISNFHDFFILFMILSGLAGVILLCLTRFLSKLAGDSKI